MEYVMYGLAGLCAFFVAFVCYDRRRLKKRKNQVEKFKLENNKNNEATNDKNNEIDIEAGIKKKKRKRKKKKKKKK